MASELEIDHTEKWQCDSCLTQNKLTAYHCDTCNAETNVIRIRVSAGGDVSSFVRKQIQISYSSSTTIGDVIKKAMKQIHIECHPKKFYTSVINDNSFIGKYVMGFHKNKKEWDNLCATPLTQYAKMTIMRTGLSINILNKYTHNVDKEDISCKYIQGNDEKSDPLQCPVYKAMFVDGQYSKENLNHLFEDSHFKDEFKQKAKCKHGLECAAFVRLKKGQNLLSDECHIKLYSHPPRNDRQIKLESNIHSFVYNTNTSQNYAIYSKSDHDYAKYEPFNEQEKQKGNGNPGYINALIAEVIRNGFKADLYGVAANDEDIKNDNYPILAVVDNKYHHIRHQQMGCPLNRGQILALILYTGCECNYDLCKSQRNGDYKKWKWFDFCLYYAIKRLGFKEQGTYKLYSGLSGVKVNKKDILSGYFPTYTSTSWKKIIALNFVYTKSDKGMVVEFDEQYRSMLGVLCCNVSWISKFPDECEVLIARSAGNVKDDNGFALNVLDETDGIQTIALTKRQQTQKEQLLELFGDQLANNPDLMKLLG